MLGEPHRSCHPETNAAHVGPYGRPWGGCSTCTVHVRSFRMVPTHPGRLASTPPYPQRCWCVPRCHRRPVASVTMNRDQHRATEVRRRALVDQIDGLERAGRRDESHVTHRPPDTSTESTDLEAVGHAWATAWSVRP
jgi:hypothetical protein